MVASGTCSSVVNATTLAVVRVVIAAVVVAVTAIVVLLERAEVEVDEEDDEAFLVPRPLFFLLFGILSIVVVG